MFERKYPFHPRKLITNIEYINNLHALANCYGRLGRRIKPQKLQPLDEEEIIKLAEEEDAGGI